MWLLFGIVLWYPSLNDDYTLLITCRGHHLTMATRAKSMDIVLLTNHSKVNHDSYHVVNNSVV